MSRALRPILAAAAVLLGACGSPRTDGRVGIDAPERASFAPVGALLAHRCGSLDCHGSVQRNLVVYGCEGLRLDPRATPGCRRTGGVDTSDAELDATYRAVVGLEPNVMTAVVAGKGRDVELLTLVRKARGWDAHKGGAPFVPGDAGDLCLASWLSGATDALTCAAAVARPEDADGGP